MIQKMQLAKDVLIGKDVTGTEDLLLSGND